MIEFPFLPQNVSSFGEWLRNELVTVSSGQLLSVILLRFL